MALTCAKMRVVVAPLPDSHVVDNSPAGEAPQCLSEPATPLTQRAQPTPPPVPLELMESEESFLGAGSRGEVRLARLGDMYCAAKIVPLPRPFAAEPPRQKGEGSSSPNEALVHPHLVRVYERRTMDGKTFELRELCQGGELFDSIAENGGLAPDAASSCFSQALEAVAFCHAAGVANGRLRPEHILIDSSNHVKLLGFAARPGGADGGAQEPLRRPCSGLDAPELHGRDTASARELARADLWALGMLLASLVTAEPPFAAADAAVCSRYATLVSQGLRVACPELSAAMPAPLLSLLERLLRPKPQDRPSAEEALAQLSGAPTDVAEAGKAAACAATSSASSASSSAGGGEAALLATAPFAAAAAAAASIPFGALSPTPPTTAVLAGTAGHANRSSSGGCAKRAQTIETHVAVDAAAKAEDERGLDHSSKVLRTTQNARTMPPPLPPRVAAPGSSSSSPGLMPPPPPRVATPRPSPRNGHVRCLGWENLEVPFDLLSSAAVATLDTLGLPYTVESWVGPFGAAFSVRPPPPLEMALPPMPELRSPALPAAASDAPSFADMASPLAPLALSLHGMSPRPPLRVSLQIFSAEPAHASASASASARPDRHHVDVRRQQGEHWHFQPFYAAFRLEFSKRLGMADYTQLSMHSPMQKKREVPAACAPAAGFLSRGQPSASPLSSPAGSPWTAASPLAQRSPGGTPGSSRGATGGAGSFRRKSGSFTGFLPLAAAPSSLRAPPRP